MSLTENQLKALKPKDKPYKLADERGLYVEVAPTGGKLWRYRYRIGKVEKKLSIGTYPDLSLKQARQAALEARMVVSKGGDPALDKRKMKIRAEHLAATTFKEVAREYIDQMMVNDGKAEATIVKANYFLDQLAPATGHWARSNHSRYLPRSNGLARRASTRRPRNAAPSPAGCSAMAWRPHDARQAAYEARVKVAGQSRGGR